MTSYFDDFAPVIGLECHVQLLTKTKLFSPARNRYGDLPNTNVDVVDIGLPGTLPVVNHVAVDFAVRLGLALNCKINKESVFARKHYFYPDLPKGYQISQFDKPICEHGKITINTSQGKKEIRITRIHMEEDAGKNIHVEGGTESFVDYNRAGTPLLEVVTEPDMTTAEEAMEFYKALRAMVTYLEICDGNLQEGSMRADVNVSVKRRNDSKLGTRTETKNLNSIRFVGQAIEFESRRQAIEILAGNTIKQETRLWDSNQKASRPLRSKEEAHDYRYFPDPDLLPLILTDERIQDIRDKLPELPQQKTDRFCSSLGLSEYDAQVLTSEKAIANYFESALSTHNNAKGIANWIINELLRAIKTNIDDDNLGLNVTSWPIAAPDLAKLVHLIDSNVISGKIAKSVFEEMIKGEITDPNMIVEKHGWKVERDESKLRIVVEQVIKNHPDELARYKSGKAQLFGFFVGQIMKETQGKADPSEANRLLKEMLG